MGETVRGYRVTGRVQGVGFRWWVRREALALGLSGLVWNEGDGSVQVHLSGAEDGIREMARRLERGPVAARVERVVPVPPSPGIVDGEFRIER